MCISRLARVAAMLIALLAASTPVRADQPEAAAGAGGREAWDQAEMTELSAALSDAMRELRAAYRREPAFRDQNSPNRHAALQMEQTLRQLEQSTRQLASRVAAGGGLEETQGIARRIGMLLNDADMWGRRMMATASMDERLRPAVVLIDRIAPFYGSAPLFDPETLERADRPANPDRRRPEAGKQ